MASSPNTAKHQLLVAVVSACIFIAVSKCWADDTTSDDSSSFSAASILLKLSQQWVTIRTLKYEIETRDTESEGFRRSINETGHDRDILMTHLTFMVKGADFGWKADTYVPSTGTHERVSAGGLTNGMLSILFQGRRAVLAVSKNPGYESAIPVAGCNPLMEAFSFLVTDDWRGFNCPSVKLDSLLSPSAWADAAKRVTSVSVENLGPQPCVKVVFGSPTGNHDIVYFPKDLNGFPLDWQHYEGSYMRREVTVAASEGKSVIKGNSITFPVKVKRCDFYDPANPNVFCTSEQTLSGLQINQNVNDEDLIIDPSLADTIFDRDNNRHILIPK